MADQTAAANKRRHLVSLSLTKTADALIEPKLVLTWLLTALGAPAYLGSAAVPIREGGALLPQPLIAGWARRTRHRKTWWALGALVQGGAALAIAASALLLDGALAGWAILAALAVFSFGRAIASTTYKDALARTVPEGERGSVTGLAGSIAAAGGLAFGAAMALGLFGEVSLPVVIGAVAVAGALYLSASVHFRGLDEPAQTDADGDAPQGLAAFLRPLAQDANFRRFVIARALLTVTALAPPFLVMASGGTQSAGLTTLGPLVIASGLAAILSSAIWGRLSDWSARLTIALGGALAAVIYATAAVLILAGDASLVPLTAAALLFVAQVGYQGVRSGRSIYLTDMASDENRLRYTALSNTLIGAVLIVGLGLGGVAHVFGAGLTLGLCALLSATGAGFALALDELSETRS